MACAVLVVAVLHQLLPGHFRISPHWVYPTFLVVFLAVLVIGDPGRIDRDRRWLRVTTDLMIALITLVNGVSAVRLVVGILDKKDFESARQLLLTGGVIWVTNVITFALWYWDLDGGGAAARASKGTDGKPGLRLPGDEPARICARRLDAALLRLPRAVVQHRDGVLTTDVSSIKHWAKALTSIESLISLVLAALVIARAINIL